MNIYDYINFNYAAYDSTRETAEYCQSIGQTWTPFEMAVIIGRSNCTITQKLKAWRELISDYPDMPTIPSSMCPVSESLHKALRELIAYEESILSIIETQEQDVFYEYSFPGYDWITDDNNYYSYDPITEEHKLKADELFPIIKYDSFEEACIAAENKRKFYESKGYTIDSIEIEKTYDAPKVCGTSGYCIIHGYYNTSGEFLNYDYFIRRPHNVKSIPDIDKGIAEAFYHFQVYIPKPRAKNEYVMLNEDERMLFYAIQKILDEWHPLEYEGYPPESDEYNGYTRAMFRILQNGGGEKELNDYWENSGIEREGFEAKAKEISRKLAKLK
jgi:hypothetical protein